MVVGLMFAGVVAGLGAFALALAGGQPVWFALLAYAGAGSLAVLALAVPLVLTQGADRPRRTPPILAARRG